MKRGVHADAIVAVIVIIAVAVLLYLLLRGV